jgi:hypothetical protein
MGNAVNGIEFSAPSVRLRIGSQSRGGVISIELPKVDLKEELITLIGEQMPSVRTEGMITFDKAKLTLTAVGWKQWLALLPDRYMDYEFPIVGNQRHVTVPGSYSTILGRCRIVSKQNGKWGGDEKGTPVNLELQPMFVLERGDDGKWKTAGRKVGSDPALDPWTKALMF